MVPPLLVAEYAGDEVIFFTPAGRRDVPLVVLAGHYDTVPAQDNLPGEIREGAVHGLGASDMKGGLAVAIELVRDLAVRDLGPYDVISFPTGVARRFMNVTWDEPGREHLLMFIIGGNQPQAEFTPLAMKRCEEWQQTTKKKKKRA